MFNEARGGDDDSEDRDFGVAAEGAVPPAEPREAHKEAALDSEPIPLGHRQTIRRYFELIRPQGAEADLKTPGADPAAAETPPGK